MMVFQDCEYNDVMVVYNSTNGFEIMEFQLLSHGDITSIIFKHNVPNGVDREVI